MDEIKGQNKIRRIFVVDDSATSRMMIQHRINSLEIADLEILTFDAAKPALIQILTNPPDAVICDITMPGASGLQLVAAVRERGIKVPIALATASVSESTKKEAADVGADGFLEKPVSLELLSQFLADHAGIGRAVEVSPLFEDDEEMALWARDGFSAIGERYSSLNLEALDEPTTNTKAAAVIGASIDVNHRGDLRKVAVMSDWLPAKALAQTLFGMKPTAPIERNLVRDALGELLNIALANVLKQLDELMEKKGLAGEKITLSPPVPLERQQAERLQSAGHCLTQRYRGVGAEFTFTFCVTSRHRL